jgi:hypothetical protein
VFFKTSQATLGCFFSCSEWAFELPRKVRELEEIAEKLPRAVGYDNCVRLGDQLQRQREVRGLADDASLLRFTRPYQIADHHEPGRDLGSSISRQRGTEPRWPR